MSFDYRAMIWQAVRGKELGRPVSLNAERKQSHWGVRNDQTGTWRRAARKVFTEGLESGEFTEVDVVRIQVVPRYVTGPLPDVGSVAPTAKAVIDGMVDAGLIPDDLPAHLERITYLRPLIGTVNGLGIRITEGQPITGHLHRSECGCRDRWQQSQDKAAARRAERKAEKKR